MYSIWFAIQPIRIKRHKTTKPSPAPPIRMGLVFSRERVHSPNPAEPEPIKGESRFATLRRIRRFYARFIRQLVSKKQLGVGSFLIANFTNRTNLKFYNSCDSRSNSFYILNLVAAMPRCVKPRVSVIPAKRVVKWYFGYFRPPRFPSAQRSQRMETDWLYEEAEPARQAGSSWVGFLSGRQLPFISGRRYIAIRYTCPMTGWIDAVQRAG